MKQRVYILYSLAILFFVQSSLWAQAKTMTYTVKTGDTFYSIARQHKVSYSALKQHNIHVNINYIEVGQRLKIPIIKENQEHTIIKQQTLDKSFKKKKKSNKKRKQPQKVAVEVVTLPIVIHGSTVDQATKTPELVPPITALHLILGQSAKARELTVPPVITKPTKAVELTIAPEKKEEEGYEVPPDQLNTPIALPEQTVAEKELQGVTSPQESIPFAPPSSDPMPILWEKLIAKDNSNLYIEYDYTPTDVTKTTGGNFIIAAYKRPFRSTRSFEQCLIKVDAYGNKLWEKNYGQGKTQNVIETLDGNYVLVGGNQVIKLFPDGSKIWTKKMSEYLLSFVVETPDHQIIVASEQKAYCLSAFGKESWSPTRFKKNHYVHSVLATSSGKLLFVGRKKTNGLSEQIWITKTNMYGNIEWEQAWGKGKLDNANSVIETQDGHFVITGFSMNSQDFCDTFCPTNVFIMKITAEGQLMWTKEYSNRYRVRDQSYKAYNTAVDVLELPNKQLVIAANTSYEQANAWLLVTHSDGRLLWEKQYTGVASALVATQDQQFMLAGWDNYGGSSNIWLTQFGGLNPTQRSYSSTDVEVSDPQPPIRPLSPQSSNAPTVNHNSTKNHLAKNNPIKNPVKKNPIKKNSTQKNSIKNNAVVDDLSFHEPPTPKTSPLPTFPDPATISSGEQPNLHVLSIGTSAPDLQFTAKDAKDFANTFKNQSNQLGVGNKIFGEVRVKKLVGKKANAKNIESKVEGLRYAYGQGVIQKKDVLLVFLSSHGFLHEDKFRIQGSDYDFRSPKTTSVAYEDLLDHLDQIPCKKVIFIDACQSGSGKATVSTVTEAILSLGQKGGTITITSSSSEEKSYENPKARNGFFTEAIVTALQEGKADANKDKIISLSELMDYVRRAVPKTVGQQIGQRQNPQVIGEGLEQMPIYVVE